MTAWYYGEGPNELGPIDESGLASLVRSGAISGESQLRQDASSEFVRAGDAFPDLFLAPASPPGTWVDTKPHPWRRYGARMIDNLIVGGLTWGLIGLFLGVFAPSQVQALAQIDKLPGGAIIDLLLTLASAMPGNALMIGLTGLSLGKWIFGARVLRNGRPIGFRSALGREFEVWWRGLACGVPIISLVTLSAQCTLLESKKRTPWDTRQKNDVTHRPDTLLSRIWMWGAVLLWVAMSAGLRLLAAKP
jgi:uncharacterized RDD family membrane protein YckC